MLVGVITEIRNQFVQVTRIGLERTTGREMNIANDLVDTNDSRDIATFVCLLSQFFCPSLRFAL